MPTFAKTAHLKMNSLSQDVPRAATRDGFGRAMLELGESEPRVMALTADLGESTRLSKFQRKWPERFVQIGVAEQNMLAVATGLALNGKIPFAASFSVFSPGRNWDQIRVSICYNQANVKIVGSHAGLLTGPDGATHQALEDIAITRVLPKMTVLVPADEEEAYKATLAAAALEGPVYLRLTRPATPIMTSPKTPFAIGRAQVWREGKDVAIIGCGPAMHEALVAADRLIEKGISARVINSPSVKPLDEETIIKAARECGAIVSVEDHQIAGGLGSAIAETLAANLPTPQFFIGVRNSFGQSGEAEELYLKYGLTAINIGEVARRVIRLKH